MFRDYPEVYNWEFFFEGIAYKLLCKENMYKKSYKFKLSDVRLVDKSIDKEENRRIRERIVIALNSEHTYERKKSKTIAQIRRRD